MFLHIGEDIVIPLKDIVGIFDIKIRENNSTKEFLQIASEEGFIKEKNEEEEKSFILTSENVYYSSISSATLRKRLDNLYIEQLEAEEDDVE
ncbi:extracellular matrix regulator RemB [Natranaerofaba carboxydovora]|uniref:extracellular matrix regulator RemB n=1 Tax=Natranaerofaba carboxydovora TaxID=2742683 RepID=UPI001F13682D|nr:extracellular matrix/biofilm biosynthesis regulator RemA family protein [Natranaerofaba carboxydovora]UMZ75192.1 hypothetical protein ACONDI_02807 [Natranaerofaba carboxydovora]